MKHPAWLVLVLLLLLATPATTLAGDEPMHEGRLLKEWIDLLCGEDVLDAIGAQDALLRAGLDGVPDLVNCLGSEDPHARHVAVHTLALLGHDAAAARNALCGVMVRADPVESILMTEAFARMGPEAVESLEFAQAMLRQEPAFYVMPGKIATLAIEGTPPFDDASDPVVEGLHVSQWTWRLICPVRPLREEAHDALARVPADVLLPWMMRWLYREAVYIALTEPDWTRLSRRLPSEAAAALGLGTEGQAARLLAQAKHLDDRDFDRAVMRLLLRAETDVTPMLEAFMEVARLSTGHARRIALRILQQAPHPDPSTLPFLVGFLQEDGSSRAYACKVLGRLQLAAAEALPQLRKALEAPSNEDPWWAGDARLAIRRIEVGDDALIAGLGKEEEHLRRDLVRALCAESTPPKRFEAMIVKALADEDILTVQGACSGLLDRGASGVAKLVSNSNDPTLLPVILNVATIRMLVDSEESKREDALCHPNRSEEEDEPESPLDLFPFVSVALRALEGNAKAQEAGIDFLIHAGPAGAEAAPRLRAILEGREGLDYGTAAEALGSVTAGTSDAVDLLVGFLASDSVFLASSAAGGLSRIGLPAASATPAVIDALRRCVTETSKIYDSVKRKATFPPYWLEDYGMALARLTRLDGAAVTVVRKALNDERREVRWACVYALERVGSSSAEAMDGLEQGLNDPDETVAVLAAAALVRMIGNHARGATVSRCPYDQLDPFFPMIAKTIRQEVPDLPAARIFRRSTKMGEQRLARIMKLAVQQVAEAESR